MNVKFCDLKKNYNNIKEEVNDAIFKVLEDCNYIGGNAVTTFENNFALYNGVKHCIGVGNGTDALEIAISSLNLPVGSEIIVQGNTYIATCLAVINNKHKLVLCDVNKDTHMIDLKDLKNKITPKTKAIILVHLYGFMININSIIDICLENRIFLIEDCAQSHGATFLNKKAGSFGILSCFSFYPSKNLGAFGDGGCIMTNDDILSNIVRKKANLGSIKKYHHEIIGRNSRLDTIQAVVLNTKLKYLDDNNNKRRIIAMLYNIHLINIKEIYLPCVDVDCVPVYHLYVIRAKNRDELQEFLKNNGIETGIHYKVSIAETDAIKNIIPNMNVTNCIILSNEILSLPMYPEMDIKEVLYVCEKIKEFYD